MKKAVWILFGLLLLTNRNGFALETTEMPVGGYIPLKLECMEETMLWQEQEEEQDAGEQEVCCETHRILMAEDAGSEVLQTQYYGYQTLLQEGMNYAQAYCALVDGITNRESEIPLRSYKIPEDKLDMVVDACFFDHPEFFFLNCSGGTYYRYLLFQQYCVSKFCPSYIEALCDEADATAFETAAEQILQNSGARDGMSQYDKAIMIHNELAARITYDTERGNQFSADYEEILKISDPDEQWEAYKALVLEYADMHTAYNALVKGKVVCDGYAKAYQYLLYKAGIVSHMVGGYGNGIGHAWNLVKLDGNWYYTDLTWDDNANGPVFYHCFNMNDARMVDSGHVLDMFYRLPACTSDALSYYTVNGGAMESPDMENIVAQLKENSYARVYFTGDSDDVMTVWNWYKTNIKEIARQVGITGEFFYDGFRAKRELFLFLYHDTAAPMKNTAVEVCSMTERNCRIFAGFYDEEDRLLKMGEMKDVSLQANTVTVVKFTDAPEGYHSVKYFIWDQLEGMKPLYQKVSAEY